MAVKIYKGDQKPDIELMLVQHGDGVVVQVAGDGPNRSLIGFYEGRHGLTFERFGDVGDDRVHTEGGQIAES